MTTETRSDAPGQVIPIVGDEFADFATEARAFLDGQREEKPFIGFRLKQGVYGQRQADVNMVRVKLPMGGVSADQMEMFGQIAEKYTPLKKGHLTTRQNIQLHFIPLDQMPDALREMGSVGLSSREACGNVVRNVTADPWAGITDEEPFDVTPYAGAFVRYWVRNPLTQLLPRKFKVYFTGRESDLAIAAIHDLAFIAQVRTIDGQAVRGFRVLVGGGLSTSVKHALLLREFVPLDDFLRQSEAVLRIFNDADELRKSIHKARLKFLVHRLGEDAFRDKVDEYLRQDWAQTAPDYRDLLFTDDEAADAPPPVDPPQPSAADEAAFARFRQRRVRPQAQAGYCAIEVKAPQGDLTPDQFRGLAAIMRRYGNGRARVTWGQNVLLRWIPEGSAYPVWQALGAIDLAEADAGEITDVISCPGTDSCKLGITSSMGLNRAIVDKLHQLALDDDASRRIRVHISGCPNSCGQHHIANIGFHGAAIKQGRRQLPAYHVYLGGSYQDGKPLRTGTIAKLRLPAKRVPEAVERFVNLYRRDRHDGEAFNDYFDRVGVAPFEAAAQDLTLPPEFGQDSLPMFIDWEREGLYVLQRGEGECAV